MPTRPFYNPWTKNKYNANRTEYNGVMYASKREATKAQELDLLKKAGEVLEWVPHPIYYVLPRFYKFKKKYQGIKYIPDFWIKWKDGREELIDIKGFATPLFKIKEKMFNYRFPDLKLTIEK
jgi:hypothetical protein